MKVETHRLIIRDWDKNDLIDMYEINSDERVNPNAGCMVIKDIERIKKALDLFILKKQSFAIELKQTKKVIGIIGMDDILLDEGLNDLKQKYIGYRFNSIYWGNGYATETASAFIEYLFKELNIDMVWSSHYDFNISSKRVIEKCGLRYQFSKLKKLKILDYEEVEEVFYNIMR